MIADVLADPVHYVRGQYDGYLAVPGVSPGSQTETFAALRLEIDNWRSAGVPFFESQPAGCGLGSMVKPSVPSTATAPDFPPSKSPDSRRWPVANS